MNTLQNSILNTISFCDKVINPEVKGSIAVYFRDKKPIELLKTKGTLKSLVKNNSVLIVVDTVSGSIIFER